MTDESLMLSKDTFLGALGLRQEEKSLRSPEERALLYQLAVQYAQEVAAPIQDSEPIQEVNELSFKIPGSSLTVRLSRTNRDELSTLVGLALVIFGLGHVDPKEVTIGTLMALSARVQRLHVQYGERSVVDALMKRDRPTTQNVTLYLSGYACRYPNAECRFMTIGEKPTCAISLDQVEATLQGLMDRGIVRQLNASYPAEYGVVL